MSQATHTPGPWTAELDTTITRADARLIAAAPVLPLLWEMLSPELQAKVLDAWASDPEKKWAADAIIDAMVKTKGGAR
jgi:hypothetical protein